MAASFFGVGGPVPATARQGRHKQRYGESGERLVAGCIPVRHAGGDWQHAELCMITTTSGTGLVFPKGGWEDDESLECAAARETVEEAGVRGVLEHPLLGEFNFAAGKHVVEGQPPPTPHMCKAYIYVMHVMEELPCWPESKDRQRVWCTIPEAARQCKHQWMRDAIQLWVQRKGWDEACVRAQPTPLLPAQPHPQQLLQQQQQQQPGVLVLGAAAVASVEPPQQQQQLQLQQPEAPLPNGTDAPALNGGAAPAADTGAGAGGVACCGGTAGADTRCASVCTR